MLFVDLGLVGAARRRSVVWGSRMKKRLLWATLLLCPFLAGITIFPVFGQTTRPAEQSVGRASSPAAQQVTIQVPPTVHRGFRYFRFKAERNAPERALPRVETPPLQIAVPARPELRAGETLRNSWRDCRQGVGNIGQAVRAQVEHLQAAGRWCSRTANHIANLCTAIGDSCRRLGKVSAQFSGTKAQAAEPPAASPAPAAGVYRYTWVNGRGDTFFTNNPKYDPNQGGKPVWRRVDLAQPAR